jgi:type IV secretion system protein TrbD
MADAPTPRTSVIHASINRPTQWLGGDRELIIITAVISFVLGLTLATWWGVGLAIVLWLSAVAILQRMGKADPLLRQVYAQHIRFRYFYPAKSGLHSSGISVKRSWC